MLAVATPLLIELLACRREMRSVIREVDVHEAGCDAESLEEGQVGEPVRLLVAVGADPGIGCTLRGP